MKNITLTILLFISTITCFGQKLFFDKLNTSAWTSASYCSDSTIIDSKEIQLKKINFPKDSLKANVTIWNFKYGLLTIVYYDFELKTEKMIATYKYETNEDKGILKIILADNKRLEYNASIISTGNYALLIKKKVKRKN